MPSTEYRYFCLDSSGKLHDTQWFKADSDEEAIAYVEGRHPESKCEIWEGRRLVAKLRSGHKVDIIADDHRTLDRSLEALRGTASMIDGRGSSAAS